MNISVLGDGSWGTTLAILLAGNGHDVCLWSPFEENAQAMQRDRCNKKFLGDFSFPDKLMPTADCKKASEQAELVLIVIPTQFMRDGLKQFEGCKFKDAAVFVSATKGIEISTLLMPSQIVCEILGCNHCAVLSGPSHAEEVAKAVPTAVTVAADSYDEAELIQKAFMNDFFRVYTSVDAIGVELGGALKNIFAVAAGICDGMGLGDNSKAALVTRGIAEMARLGSSLGGEAETFAGLSGVGDMIVTCTSQHSRNRHVGEELGKGKKLDDIIKEMDMTVAEGVTTTKAAYTFKQKHDIETPIIDEMYAVLYENKPASEAARDLMTRRATAEKPMSE